jgi:transposase-like protein
MAMSRRRLDRELFWRRLIARQASSRLTIGELCRQAGVSTASFYAWRQRLGASSGAGSSLVPVRIASESSGREIGGEITIELALKFGDRPAHAVRVSIPPGCDEASIRRVLRAIVSADDGRDAARGGTSAC